MSKQKTKKHKVIILFEPGSEFQSTSAMKNLEVMLYAWESFYLHQHKRNKINIVIKELEPNNKDT